MGDELYQVVSVRSNVQLTVLCVLASIHKVSTICMVLNRQFKVQNCGLNASPKLSGGLLYL